MSIVNTLGYRQNNPLNMRPLSGGQMWHGQTGVTNGFCVFSEPRWCFRAWLIEAHSYKAAWNCVTVYDYVKHYAPPEDENNPEEYAIEVENYMTISHNSPIDIDKDKLGFCKGQMTVEIGGVPYPDAMILEGFSWVASR